MGRRGDNSNPEAKVRLFKIRMSGDYDEGGAYWGAGEPIYATLGDDFAFYMRASSRIEAKVELLKLYPRLRFYR